MADERSRQVEEVGKKVGNQGQLYIDWVAIEIIKQPIHDSTNMATQAIRSAAPKDLLSLSPSELIKTMAVIIPANCPIPGNNVNTTVRNTFIPLLNGVLPCPGCGA
ncbi:MAG: hypothetical protein ACOX4M_09995 [Acetivibrionales bacterium]